MNPADTYRQRIEKLRHDMSRELVKLEAVATLLETYSESQNGDAATVAWGTGEIIGGVYKAVADLSEEMERADFDYRKATEGKAG